nr:UDP-N-acetylmuramate dehydrogenase [Chloroflexota bacterium]
MGLAELSTALGDKAIANEPLSRHTTFGIGGPADLFVVAHTLSELRRYVRLAWEQGVPYFILGSGANLLVSDKGIRGLVIHNQCQDVQILPGGEEQTGLVIAESGAAIRAVARQTIAQGLAGLEWAVDVPGTVGGAVVGNAGAYGGYVSDSLRGVTVFSPKDGERWWRADELDLGYRTSRFKRSEHAGDPSPVILSATFALRREDAAWIQQRAAEYSQRRAESQPTGLSAGSVFKRTEKYPAGFLIENAGLKGKQIGGAVVSPQHANFIINLGTATARDVQQLIELIRETVYAKFKIQLELEIQLVGEW